MVHEGNLVRANDTTPLVVINQVTPIYVSFAIPEAQLAGAEALHGAGHARVEAQPPNDDGAAVDRPHHVRRQRRRSDDRHDQDQGHVPERRPPAVARAVRQRRRDADDRSATRSSCRRPPCRPASRARTSSSSSRTRPSELRPVDVARTRGNETVIKSGVEAGETVVTDGQLRLVPGSRVSVKTAERPPKAAS